MKRCLLFAALAAVPLVSVAADTVTQDKSSTVAASTPPQVSQERIARLRAKLVAQIAAYEPSEQAMRTPTAQERAALVLPSGNTTMTVVKLPNGGTAVQGDVSSASLAIAVRGNDGKVNVGHDDKPQAATAKGDAHAR